jgi:hypothetical protein
MTYGHQTKDFQSQPKKPNLSLNPSNVLTKHERLKPLAGRQWRFLTRKGILREQHHDGNFNDEYHDKHNTFGLFLPEDPRRSVARSVSRFLLTALGLLYFIVSSTFGSTFALGLH